MQKFLILVAAMAAVLTINVSGAKAQEPNEPAPAMTGGGAPPPSMTDEAKILGLTNAAIDGKLVEVRGDIATHKTEIAKLERKLGRAESELVFGARAFRELGARLDSEHRGLVAAKTKLNELEGAKAIAVKAAGDVEKLRHKANRNKNEIAKVRKGLTELVKQVEALKAFDAEVARQVGGLIGRTVALEEKANGHELTLKVHGEKLATHDSAIEKLGEETARLKGQTDGNSRAIYQVKREALRNEIAMEVGYTTGIATAGTALGLSARLQGGDSSFGLIFGGNVEVGKDGDKAHVGAAYGRFGLALSPLASPFSAFLVGFAGAASDTGGLAKNGGLVGGAELGGTFTVFRFLKVGASVGPVFGAYGGWKADLFVGLNLLDLIQQANTPTARVRVEELL